MTANFRVNNMDRLLGGHALKLSINGSTAYEQLFVLEQALSTAGADQIQSVVWGIDLGRFNERYGEFSQETGAYPHHLYAGGLQLLRYTMSLQTTLHSARTLASSVFGLSFPLESSDINGLNTWDRSTGCQPVLEHFDTIVSQSGFLANRGYTFRTDVFDAHLDDIVALARSNPDTEFVLFYSPYSIIRYKRIEQLGGIDHFMRLREAFAKRVETEANIQLLDLQADASIVTELDYYKDVGHYDQNVNALIMQAIQSRQFSSVKKVGEQSQTLRKLIERTDVENIRASCDDESRS
ncbi:MAG: hypothetical protein AAF465_07880 [Pseudomonadota bacterium]